MTPTKVGCPKCKKIVTAKRDRKTGVFVPRKHKCIQVEKGEWVRFKNYVESELMPRK